MKGLVLIFNTVSGLTMVIIIIMIILIMINLSFEKQYFIYVEQSCNIQTTMT